jgi:Flp pilus assembly pilin Flp
MARTAGSPRAYRTYLRHQAHRTHQALRVFGGRGHPHGRKQSGATVAEFAVLTAAVAAAALGIGVGVEAFTGAQLSTLFAEIGTVGGP